MGFELGVVQVRACALVDFRGRFVGVIWLVLFRGRVLVVVRCEGGGVAVRRLDGVDGVDRCGRGRDY